MKRVELFIVKGNFFICLIFIKLKFKIINYKHKIQFIQIKYLYLNPIIHNYVLIY